MLMLRRTLPLALCLSACPAPWPMFDECTEGYPCDTAASPDASDTSTSTIGPIATVTGEEQPTSPGGETTAAPDGRPTIVAVELEPNPITINGAISVTVTADHSDAVRMQLDTGEQVPLDPLAKRVFHGEISILSGFANGEHVVSLTPRYEDVDGAPVDATYTVALPTPGSQGFWEAGGTLGPGRVDALAVLPTGDVVELGTLKTNAGDRCYLRRRDKGGAWAQSDVVDLVPDVACSAIDLKSDADGALFALVEREVLGETLWWLARIPTWKAEPVQVGLGNDGEIASALAVHPSGKIAACGFAPATLDDQDATAWIFNKGMQGETRSFDYEEVVNENHVFSERARDCVFVEDSLVLVGEANGLHGEELMARDRLFTLVADKDTPVWHVDPAATTTQSGAQAVDVDDLGRLVLGGFVCDDDCQPVGELRTYALPGSLVTSIVLDEFWDRESAVQDLVWSPAGYAIVATGGPKDDELAFIMRAYAPMMQVAPVWSFKRADDGVFHMALALVVGKYAEAYGGGIGKNGLPAFMSTPG